MFVSLDAHLFQPWGFHSNSIVSIAVRFCTFAWNCCCCCSFRSKMGWATEMRYMPVNYNFQIDKCLQCLLANNLIFSCVRIASRKNRCWISQHNTRSTHTHTPIHEKRMPTREMKAANVMNTTCYGVYKSTIKNRGYCIIIEFKQHNTKLILWCTTTHENSVVIENTNVFKLLLFRERNNDTLCTTSR